MISISGEYVRRKLTEELAAGVGDLKVQRSVVRSTALGRRAASEPAKYWRRAAGLRFAEAAKPTSNGKSTSVPPTINISSVIRIIPSVATVEGTVFEKYTMPARIG